MAQDSTLPLSGKVAGATEASNGIQPAMAQRLAVDGANICLVTARADSVVEAAAESPPQGQRGAVAGRVEDPGHRALVGGSIAAAWGNLDILVNSAGINPLCGKLNDHDLGMGRKALQVNVRSALARVQAACRHRQLSSMRHRGVGVNLPSAAGMTASERLGWYGSPQATVSHLTTALDAELRPEVRVNAAAPAVVKTHFAQAVYEVEERDVPDACPLKCLGEPGGVVGRLHITDLRMRRGRPGKPWRSTADCQRLKAWSDFNAS